MGPPNSSAPGCAIKGIEAFEYLSARSSDALVRVGVFTPAVFQSTPFDQVEISTEISADHTTFLCQDDGKLHRFARELFLIDGGSPGAASACLWPQGGIDRPVDPGDCVFARFDG
jgi:hypothetical protein